MRFVSSLKSIILFLEFKSFIHPIEKNKAVRNVLINIKKTLLQPAESAY